MRHSRYAFNIRVRPEVRQADAKLTKRERKIRKIYKALRELNYRNALVYLLEEVCPGFKIRENYILNLHKIVQHNFHLLSPGSYRSDITLLDDQRVGFAPPGAIGPKMRAFLKGINSRRIHPIEKAACDHHKFSLIHPFKDGNGRIGRLIIITQLLSRGLPPPIIESGDDYQRSKYYRALERADSGDFSLMIDFVFRSMVSGAKILSRA